MPYEFIKLSEVELVGTPHNANLLIEEDGEIKRLSTDNINFGGGGQQVQADWNETDDTSPAYIANKPDIGLSNVVVYTLDSGGLFLNGDLQTPAQVIEAWDNGVNMRIQYDVDSQTQHSPIVTLTHYSPYGREQCTIYFMNKNSIISHTLYTN